MTNGLERLDPLERYTVASELAAEQIIAAYSTSFGLATRLLGPRHRRHVRNVYALVRVADELVDGVAAGASFAPEQQHAALDLLESETEQAMHSGYSSNPIVHAFARTARCARIDVELTRPFFASMRTDLQSASFAGGAGAPVLRFEDAAHADYVYGSAEVIGLMCLRIFMREEACTDDAARALEHGARRLGAAFQNVNFLRDLGDDTQRLGRGYLGPGEEMSPDVQERWVTTIREPLDDASATLPLLPRDARVAVACALRLFAALTERIARTPASMLHERRVRVAAPVKGWLVLRSALDPYVVKVVKAEKAA